MVPFTQSCFSFAGRLTSTPSLRAVQSRAGQHQRRSLGAGDLADAKANLFDMLDDEMLVKEIMKPESRSIRGRVDEAIVQLERVNPTQEPVYSESLDGTWKVKYAGAYAPGLLSSPTRELALFLYSGGFSPGNLLASFTAGFWGQALGLDIGERRVTITLGREVEASAEVTVGGQKETLKYKADLMPMSSCRMNEEVVSFDLPGPLGKQEALLELRRTLLVTYLDDKVMVVRDESGVPEVLVKELSEVAPQPEPVPAASGNTTAESNATSTEGGSADEPELDPLDSDAA